MGNRDVNKLRFIYEFTLGPQQKLSETDFWKPKIINGITNEPDILTKLQLVLKDTMGAGGTGLQINNVLDEKGNNTTTYAGVSSDTYLAYVLLRVFNTVKANELINKTIDDDVDLQGDDKAFIDNCRLLFNEAKIVHYDSDYKVLLSHAGGFTQAGDFILDNTQYYQDILDKLKEMPAGPENYFSKIFFAQQELKKGIKEPIAPVGANTIEKKSAEPSATPSTDPSVSPAELPSASPSASPTTVPTPLPGNPTFVPELSEVLKFHNDLLKKSLKFDDVNLTPPDEYFLLQAMGLSGDPANNPNTNYYSFIASCGLNGDCQMEFNVNSMLIQKIKYKGIKFVASGHKPHCTTVPLIYQQDGVVFIAADTSNGYRPEDKNQKLKLENIPLSFIGNKQSFIGNKQSCGVCSLHPKGYLILASDTNEISALSKDGSIRDYYKDLVKAYTDFTSVPSIEAIKKILESEGKFQPLNVVKNRGGKRRSRKYNKQSKFKKRGGRKTRKFNRKTYKCGLGCRYH